MSIFSQIREATSITMENYISKAKRSIANKNEFTIDRKALSSVERSYQFEIGYRQRVSAITFDILRQMAMRNSVVASIIQTYVGKVKLFSQPQPDKYSPGFKIIMRDKDAEPSDDEKKEMKNLETWLLNTGSTENRDLNNQLGFVDFLEMSTRDLMTYDQVAIETIRANDGTLAYFLPASAGSLRFASPALNKHKDLIQTSKHDYRPEPQLAHQDDYEREKKLAEKEDKRSKDEKYKYAQVYQGQVVRGFYEDELFLKMLNPTTELDSNGYSIGPLEMAANIVSYHLFAEAHNRLFFVQGFASRGILHIEGDVPPAQLDAFRRQWREQVSGTHNSWRTPILAGGNKINWIQLSQSNRDMEWSSWVEYLINSTFHIIRLP